MKLFTFLSAILLLTGTVFGQEGLKPQMVLIEGGSFIMGSGASNNQDEKPLHTVNLKSFFMSKYEITNAQYIRFCKVTGKKEPEGKPLQAVINISWENSVQFCNWLSLVEGLENAYDITRDSSKFSVDYNREANGYRLPTEAEWEYAARGGIKSKYSAYSGGNNHNEVSWNKNNSGNRQHEVGQKQPNELGIYDLTGNVREWCWDYYEPNYYSNSEENSPTGPESGVERVVRGGHYMCRTVELRILRRSRAVSSDDEGLAGIRLVRNQ
ncbi:MAG: SUMF1/EgtB/PvdO family nonheme iron enzyme [Bacteroidota bacterium]|nr:SUMF1/EgtB/PvdO family nonheme iron enzyme [Bacteroidota bacterium]